MRHLEESSELERLGESARSVLETLRADWDVLVEGGLHLFDEDELRAVRAILRPDGSAEVVSVHPWWVDGDEKEHTYGVLGALRGTPEEVSCKLASFGATWRWAMLARLQESARRAGEL